MAKKVKDLEEDVKKTAKDAKEKAKKVVEDVKEKSKDVKNDAKAKAEDLKEEYKVKGNELVGKVKDVIKEGNARRIIIKNNKGKSILEVPVTLGVAGALFAPYLAMIGGLAAVLTSCSIVVEKDSK